MAKVIYVMKCLRVSLQMYPTEDKDQEEAGSDQVRCWWTGGGWWQMGLGASGLIAVGLFHLQALRG